MVERIEKEVEGALNSNVSILAPTFINGYKLKAFNEDDMKDYWATVEEKIGVAVSSKYKEEVNYYVGTHPCLLNLLNGSLWAEKETKDYICDDVSNLKLSEELINKLHDSFNWAVWRDMEKIYGHKHIKQTELEPFRVAYMAGVIKVLDGVELEYGEEGETDGNQ